jgi:hypothetical protein
MSNWPLKRAEHRDPAPTNPPGETITIVPATRPTPTTQILPFEP